MHLNVNVKKCIVSGILAILLAVSQSTKMACVYGAIQ